MRTLLLVSLVLVLAGCNAPNGDGRPAQTPASAATRMHPPVRTGGPQPARSVLDAMPDFSGIGPLRFGMTAQQMRKAWGLPLHGEAPAQDPQACHYLQPRKDDTSLLFMVEQDRFVRVDVRTPRIIAPGGGHVGMSAARIETLYPGRVQSAPGKYDAAAKVLSVPAPQGGRARLVFETDASGKVIAWRVGVPPQVDYVEGCG